MKPFEESDRYAYSLTPDSVVIDLGAHVGTWSRLICEKYDCHALAFEPIHEFAEQAIKNLAPHPKARVFTLGVGRSNRMETWAIKGDLTGATSTGERKERVNIRSIVEVLEEFGVGVVFPKVAILKLNVEGSEMEILETLLDNDLTGYFANIQCQPHACIPHAEERWEAIRERMKATHRITWHAPWCWINWELL
jgi:FkbM family methyltransferase